MSSKSSSFRFAALCALAAGFAFGEDLAVTSDMTLTLSAAASYENVSVAEGATLKITSSDNYAYLLSVTGDLTGNGTIELDKGRLGFVNEVPDTLKVKITGAYTASASENRIFCNKAASVVSFKAALIGDGIVRFGFNGGTGNGGVSIDGDNSDFEGTMLIDGANTSRMKLGSLKAGSPKSRIVVYGNTADNGTATYKTDGTLQFGSVYTDSRTTTNYAWRFNDASTTLEVGALNREDDRISIRIGEIKSNQINGKARIRKIGTGTLELWHPGHSQGTYIDDGVVLVTSDHALDCDGSSLATSSYITFGSTEDSAGGTLKYGDDPTITEGDASVMTDYSSWIANSQKAIKVDTNGKDVTYAGVLAASNVGGLVKLGEGTLECSADNLYTGLTKVEAGTLKVRQHYATDAETEFPVNGNTYEKADGANLELTLSYNQSNTKNYRPTFDFAKFPEGTIINCAVNKAAVMPRLGEVTGFKGTFNFLNVYDISSSAGGFVNTSISSFGSDDIDWGIIGEPSAQTKIFSVETANGGEVKLGALRVPSENAVVNFKNRSILKIGALNTASVINGQIAGNNITINKVGSGSLTLGAKFADIGTNTSRALNINAGKLENHADLSAWTVTLAEGVTLAGDVSSIAAVSTAKYNLEIPELEKDAEGNVDKTKVYELLTVADGAAAPLNLASALESLNAGETKGRWKIKKVNNVYQLTYQKNGLVLIIR